MTGGDSPKKLLSFEDGLKDFCFCYTSRLEDDGGGGIIPRSSSSVYQH